LFDTDGGGSISTNEIKSLFKCFDIQKTKAEIKELVRTYDTDDSGELEFDEFVLMMGNILLTETPCHEL
jgi:Ca2+-binding EF-hand superfamily protein